LHLVISITKRAFFGMRVFFVSVKIAKNFVLFRIA